MTEQEAKEIYLKIKNDPKNKVSYIGCFKDKEFYVMIACVAIFISIMNFGTKAACEAITKYQVDSGHVYISEDKKFYIDKEDGSKTLISDFNRID